jgi:hypothetical protein
MFEKTERAIKNGKSRETNTIGHTRYKTKKNQTVYLFKTSNIHNIISFAAV